MGTQAIPQLGTKSSPKNKYPPFLASLVRQWPITLLMILWLANWEGKLALALLSPRTPSVFVREFKSKPCWSYAHLPKKQSETQLLLHALDHSQSSINKWKRQQKVGTKDKKSYPITMSNFVHDPFASIKWRLSLARTPMEELRSAYSIS